MLRDQQFKAVYRSESDNLLDDFYIPALKQAARYDRAVGFFSATMLSYAAQGIAALAQRSGKIRLLFGGELEQDELDAIEDGYLQRRVCERLGAQYLTVIDNVAEALAHRRLETLAWLIASGLLDIKVALKRRGMYHEKVGILYDECGDRVVFQGSANETVYALVPDFNFESINVFQSWRPEHEEYAIPYVSGFERLWENRSPGTLVLPLPDAAHAKLLNIGNLVRPPRVELEREIASRLANATVSEPDGAGSPRVPAVRDDQPFELRAHQREALNAWKATGFRGVLAMATGSGKTITAIYAVARLFEAFRNLFVVVAVPYQALADQWVDELRLFNIAAIACYAGRSLWASDLRTAVGLHQSGALPFTACVVVNRTLQSEEFQSLLRTIDGSRLLIIGDECHYYGSEALHAALPTQAQLRLGLSATPIHYFDAVRNARITDYFGEIVFAYGLKEALRDHVLTPYRYYVHLVELTADEAASYQDLSQKISRLAAGRSAQDIEESQDSALSLLLFQRARLLANLSAKLVKLEQLLEAKPPEPYTIVYCGDGELDTEDGDDVRQIDEVSRLLHRLGWRVAHFTARESRRDRIRTLDEFRIGEVNALAAIRCLDEGIDVPACRVAYILASSRNPKQFIQRRGRILRRSPGKESAVVHDFLPLLFSDDPTSEDETARQLIVAELKRVAEFASLALNPGEVLEALGPVLDRYDVRHHAFVD